MTTPPTRPKFNLGSFPVSFRRLGQVARKENADVSADSERNVLRAPITAPGNRPSGGDAR
jgi:hypothetical protein